MVMTETATGMMMRNYGEERQECRRRAIAEAATARACSMAREDLLNLPDEEMVISEVMRIIHRAARQSAYDAITELEKSVVNQLAELRRFWALELQLAELKPSPPIVMDR
jgi:hypothetical protein